MDVTGLTNLIRDWILISALATTVAVTFGIAWFRSLRRVRELERYLLQREELEMRMPDDVARRLDEVGAQVDRLAEGQDFLSRLVAEGRLNLPRAAGEQPRAITPH